MKNLIRCSAAVVLLTSLITAHAQMGGAPKGPDFSGPMAKLFGDNTAFSATTEMQAKMEKSGKTMVMPGKMAFLDGKSRFETDMTQMKGADLPAQQLEQFKQMGMDKMVMISQPEKKAAYLIYPGLQAYAEIPTPNADAAKAAADAGVKITELGKETCEGHDCIKNKAVVTDKDGQPHEFTVWNATDLKKFPVKIEANERNTAVTILFKEVNFAKPAASQFEPPADYKKYDSMMAMMQQEMMKRMGGGMNMPR